MNEILFVVDEADDGSFRASAMGAAIHTEANNLEELHWEIRDAVHCHFEEGEAPPLIRLASRAARIVDPVKTPRDLNGADLARRLAAYGYSITR